MNDFNRLVASIQAKGVEPATGIFVPEFSKHSGQKPDENGTLKPINYYSLKWSWEERTDWSVVEQAAAVLADDSNLARMIDLEGTKAMVCLDNLSPADIAYLISTHGSAHETEELSLDSSREMALPPASEKVPAKVS